MLVLLGRARGNVEHVEHVVHVLHGDVHEAETSLLSALVAIEVTAAGACAVRAWLVQGDMDPPERIRWK